MKKCLYVAAAAVLLLSSCAGPVRKTAHGFRTDGPSARFEVVCYAPDIIQVVKSPLYSEVDTEPTASVTMSLLSLSLIVCIVTTFLGDDKEDEPSFESIASVTPMFNGMRRIQENKNYQVSQVEQMTLRGKEIKQELDSLMRIPLKSHDDSVQIVIKYKQLEMIVRNLENGFD